MAATRVLRRLLKVRQLEEEHLKTALESAQMELGNLVEAQRSAVEREGRGRVLILESVRTGELRDRLAGIEEVRFATKLRIALSMKIETAERKAEQLRVHYAAKRMECQKVDALIEVAEAEQKLTESRRTQEALDDGHRSLRQRRAVAIKRAAKTESQHAILYPEL